MDIKTLKSKIQNGEISDVELMDLLAQNLNKTNDEHERGGFLNTILKGFVDGYTTPNMLRATIEGLLLIIIIIGIIILSYAGRIDSMITAVLFAFILGFLFGKIK
jgi:hypothetical protein